MRRPIVFFHVPKTGGTSIILALLPHFVRENCILEGISAEKLTRSTNPIDRVLIAGHAWFDVLKLLPDQALKFTVLREPRDQIVSHYLHISRGNNRTGEIARRIGFKQFVTENPYLLVFQTGSLLVPGPVLMPPPTLDEAPFGADEVANNGDAALEFLDALDFVGCIERPDDLSICLPMVLGLSERLTIPWVNRTVDFGIASATIRELRDAYDDLKQQPGNARLIDIEYAVYERALALTMQRSILRVGEEGNLALADLGITSRGDTSPTHVGGSGDDLDKPAASSGSMDDLRAQLIAAKRELAALAAERDRATVERDTVITRLEAVLRDRGSERFLRRLEKRPLYIGDSRMIAFLDTGEPIIIDTRSYDSMHYIMPWQNDNGWDIERDTIALFNRMLRYDSVVLDVGANVGFYTIKAASRSARSGKIYAFEGNPHTFELLQHTLYANLLSQSPNVEAYNCLVSDREGEAQIRYSPTSLGGASMLLGPHPDLTSHTVRMVTLDGILPSDLVVDVVKIDVEGHEPHVLRGMADIIRRSPNIKIIVEYFESFLNSSFGGTLNMQNLIADLGLRMWRILGQGQLIEVPLDVPLTGNNYCLLARSIDDIGPEGDEVVIDPESLAVGWQFLDKSVPILRNGQICYDESVHGDLGEHPGETLIFYGPYISLKPGVYEIAFSGNIQGDFGVRLQYDFGREIVDQFELSSLRPRLFNLRLSAQNFEIVLIRRPTSRMLDLDRITLRR